MAEQEGPLDSYIASFPREVQSILQQVRVIVREVAPEVEERMSYDMPTFVLDGIHRLYVAAWKRHLGIYGVPTAHAELESELAEYRKPTGTIAFPYRDPIPYYLITRIVTHVMKVGTTV